MENITADKKKDEIKIEPVSLNGFTNEKSNINFYQGQFDLLKQIYDEHKDKSKEVIEEKILEEIKTKIAEFFNIKNIHFLFGSGTSSGAVPVMSGLFCSVLKKLIVKKQEEESIHEPHGIYSKVYKEFKDIHNRIKEKKNLEEVLGILYSNRIYLENNTSKVEEFTICNKLIELIEEEVYQKLNVEIYAEECKDALQNYKEFYQKMALRNRDFSRINIFTTNNDLFNETAMDSLNIHYINGFSGGLYKFFNPAMFNYTFSKRMDTSIDKYEPVDNVVNLFKIHGSVNWMEDTSDANTFFKIKEIGVPRKQDRDGNAILIYPTPTKQNKSLGSPYVELFREFQKRLLLPHSVLFIIGYSFSDEHVNNIIYQALATNSSINVVVINNIEDKSISKINDHRIFRIWGKNSSDSNIHYFNYIVENLLPNVDHNKKQDEMLKDFISLYNKSLKP